MEPVEHRDAGYWWQQQRRYPWWPGLTAAVLLVVLGAGVLALGQPEVGMVLLVPGAVLAAAITVLHRWFPRSGG